MTWNPVPEQDAQSSDEQHWSTDQMNRLEGEWRRLQRGFAYHPHISLTPLRGDPPHEFQVDYRLNTLVTDENGDVQYADHVPVHIWIPPEFPDLAPVVRPLVGVFHPNVSWDGIAIGMFWRPTETLEGLVRRIGDLLAYRHWDYNEIVNPPAAEWLNENAGYVPTDRQATFALSAGGEPLARICRYGPPTIDSYRQALLDLQANLFTQGAPDHAFTRDFVLKTRLALNLFLERDVPDALRSGASDLDDCARELPSYLPLYDYLRARRAAVAAIRQAIAAIYQAKGPLVTELDRLGAVVDAADPDQPHLALGLMPEMKVLQQFQFNLPKLIGDADRRIAALQARVAHLNGLAEPAMIHSETLLGQRLEKEAQDNEADVHRARAEADEALAAFEPVVGQAKSDAGALDQCVRWREYADLIHKGRSTERRVREWGADGVQAYFIQNESGKFGPYQFEQPLDLGGGDILARNLVRGAIEVRDPTDEKVLGEGNNGEATVRMRLSAEIEPAGDDGEQPPPTTYPTRFRLTERCDDLLVQFDFLRRQTRETLEQLGRSPTTSTAWCGRFCQLLATDDARAALDKDLARIANRWKVTMLDLAALGPFKDRVATYFLVTRAAEVVPPLVQKLGEARQGLKDSKGRLESISEKCSRDVDTDRLIIPPKLREPYQNEMIFRKECGDTIERSTRLLKTLSEQLKARLRDSKLLGKAGIPALRVIPPPSEDVQSLPLADGELGDPIVMMEGLLQMSLGGPRPEVMAEAPPEADEAEGQEETAEAAEAEADAVDFAGAGEEAHAEPAEAYADDAAAEGVEAAPVEGEAGDAVYSEAEDHFVAGEEYSEEYVETAEEESDVIAGDFSAIVEEPEAKEKKPS